MEPLDAATARRLEQELCSDDVRASEEARVDHGEAVVRLGGEVDDHVDLVLAERALREIEVGDVALDERHVFGHVLADTRVRQQVVADDVIGGMPFAPVAHEVRADEPGRARHEQTHEASLVSYWPLLCLSMQCFASSSALRTSFRSGSSVCARSRYVWPSEQLPSCMSV